MSQYDSTAYKTPEIDNFIKIYEKSFKQNWSYPALSDYTSGATLTYGDLAISISHTHILFRSIGLKPGDKVALCGKDSMQWVKIYMSVVTYGAIIVPILSDFNPVDITHIVNHSEAVLFFASQAIWEHIDPDSLLYVRGVMNMDKYETFMERGNRGIARDTAMIRRRFRRKYPEGFLPQDIKYITRDNKETVEINYTSGTTGFSKGVMLSGENLAGNVCFGMQSKLHYKGSRALAFLPLAHAYGCAFDMLTPLAVGSHITLLGKIPSPRVLTKALAEVRPNLIICVPLILEKIYKSKILPEISSGAVAKALKIPGIRNVIYSKIRKTLINVFGGEFEEVIVGGAPLNPEVEQFLHKIKFPFTVGYGMTECGPLISYTPWREFKVGSSGRTLPTMETMVMSDDPENIPGEICVRGVNVMQGYFKNKEATDLVLSDKGWLKTGDMGTRSADGTLFLRGRSKTMLLSSSGQNIYPEEIEAKLNNMPYVSESLVIMRDSQLIALVYPDYDRADRAGLHGDALQKQMELTRKELNRIVAPYEQVKSITLMPNEFEKTPKRSIKRFLYSQ